MSIKAPFAQSHWADPFGAWPQWRKDMGLGPHRGMDFNGLPEGTPIPASGTGRVTHIEWNNVLGHVGVVKYGAVYLGYCHLEERTPLDLGDIITGGVTVGRLGNTGSASTGAHLHLTASYSNGSPGTVPVIDPMQFFTGSATAGGDLTPIGGHDVAHYSRKQLATELTVREQWQRWPYALSPRAEDLAGGAGGGGLYDIIFNLYFEGFPTTEQVEGRLVLVNAATGKASNGYEFTIDGSESGEVKAAIPARVAVPNGSYLYLELRGTGDPVCMLWGADIANLTVG